ncbi:PspC domain-containing protein [Streptomyces bambusae]|uniref:PspC domain-containing protein n=1 Tax=Streptomyces bambusae TaxID=1550616 RepID=A0ABS6Z9V3_9ACTN|nr:PspC domain-containing protein [Streptomyces bambusae]MBW5484523.1 PspC domain-containing protein [Streptomyces bambusae]
MSAIVRPRDGRMIGGVCAGLARRFGMSARTMRIIFLVSCLLPGPQFLVYLALWVLLPNERPGYGRPATDAKTAW